MDTPSVIDFFRAPWVWIAVLAFGTSLGMVAYLILLERKVAAWTQDRVGPNRVGFGFGLPFAPKFHFWGLGQPMADGLKFFLKEDYRPAHVDKILFTFAPVVMMLTVIVSLVVIPWGGTKATRHSIDVTAAKLAGGADAALIDAARGQLQQTGNVPWYAAELTKPNAVREAVAERTSLSGDGKQYFVDFVTGWRFQAADLSIGVLFVISALSLAVYGVVIGGWASNNKYSFLGALRATANMISYEIPLGLSVLIVVLMFGTLDLGRLVDEQARYWMLGGFIPIPAWNIFAQPLAFTLFLICIHAEANRAPFDLAEAEQELVGGYHTEYSSMRFALFFLGEYAGMITTSCVCVALFFGGWHLPGLDWAFGKITGHGAFDAAHPSWSDSLLLCLLRMGVFFGKAVVILFVFMWVRWSLPRFRFDQLMRLAWGGLIPIAIALLMATAVIVWLTGGRSSVALDGWSALYFLVMNVVLAAALLLIMGMVGPAPSTNRRMVIPDSRFGNTPVTV
ncbi:MAG TPA: complex I subunit 1 family protein [Tepidisphaeraceae bacterium]|jgi:NADH-quinone oxidoreductase subunit H